MNGKAKARASGKQDPQQMNHRFGTRGFALKRLAKVVVCAATMVASNASFCGATETDMPLEKLLEKEVLTESEADEIRKEIDAEAGLRWGDWFTTSVFGHYVASDADSENVGYLAGLQFGHQKVGKLRDWQVKYNYRHY